MPVNHNDEHSSIKGKRRRRSIDGIEERMRDDPLPPPPLSLSTRNADGESACRRDSVQPLRAWVTIHLSGLPGEAPLSRDGRATHFPRLALLRVGFTEPTGSPRSLVRSYRTVSPLPVRTRRPTIGGSFSVALSCGSPRLAVSQHPALRSPDLPQHDPALRSGLRSPGRLTVTPSLTPQPGEWCGTSHR